MGQLIELGKPPLDRSPRAPQDLGHSPHAAIAQLPRLHRRKAPPVFFGQGCIKIPYVLFGIVSQPLFFEEIGLTI